MDLSNKKTTKKIIGLVLVAGLILWAVLNYKVALGILGWIIAALTPLLIGFAIAFILNVLMRAIETHIFKWPDAKFKKLWPKLRRAASLILSILVLSGIVTLVITMLVPQIKSTFEMLAAMLPGFWAKVQVWLDNEAVKYGLDKVELPKMKLDYNTILGFAKTYLTAGVTSAFGTAVGFMTSFIGKAVNAVLGIIFAIYMLASKEKLAGQCTKLVRAFTKPETAEEILFIGRSANKIYSGFVIGQCIEAVNIGVLCAIGMTIFRFPHVAMISVLVGFTALIPVFGAFIGTALGAFFILIDSPIMALWFVVFIIVIQQIDNQLIYPRIVGSQVGLPAMWTLLGVILGGSVGGFVGMLFGVPTLALVYMLVGRKANQRLEKAKQQTCETGNRLTE